MTRSCLALLLCWPVAFPLSLARAEEGTAGKSSEEEKSGPAAPAAQAGSAKVPAPSPESPAPSPTTGETVAPLPAGQGTTRSAEGPSTDPFSRLKVLVPRDKLLPLSSVRPRTIKEKEDRSRAGKVTVMISTTPKGATVHFGNKLLGTTPLTVTGKRGDTPMDVVIRARGYMTLRTRIRRRDSRSYLFKLTPAKIQ